MNCTCKCCFIISSFGCFHPQLRPSILKFHNSFDSPAILSGPLFHNVNDITQHQSSTFLTAFTSNFYPWSFFACFHHFSLPSTLVPLSHLAFICSLTVG